MRKLWYWLGSGRAFPAAFHLRCIVLLMVCVIRIMFPKLWRWGENIESEAPRSFIHINTGVFVCITNFPFEPNKMFGDSFNLFIPFKSKASILLAKMCCKYWCHGKMVFILCLYLNWHLTLFRDSIYQMHSYPWWVCFASTYQIRLFDERTTHAQKNTQRYRKREQEQAWKSGKWLVRKEEGGAWLEKKRDGEHIDASQINQISNKTNVKKQKKKNKKISNQYADCSAVPYETNDNNNIWDCVFE